jgi:uncharacterized protein YukE
MVARGALVQEVLEREAKAWRDLSPAEYSLAICGILGEISATPPSAEQVEALLALSSATLRRNGRTLIDSRACCAEHLLALVSATSEPALHLRIRLLLLLAWLHLGSVVERGPEYISVAPALPPGVSLPEGADLAEISDPALREQARESAEGHEKAVEHWNAKQRALGHLYHLATSVRAARPRFRDDEDAAQELAVAMSLAPGLPPELQRLLEDEAE